jgi:hypothetical protein
MVDGVSGRSSSCLAVYIRCSSRAQLVFKRERMAHNLLKSVPGRLTQLHSMVGVRQLYITCTRQTD